MLWCKFIQTFGLHETTSNVLAKDYHFKRVRTKEKKKGWERIKPQIGPLTFLKIFVLEMIYSGRSQHTEPSYITVVDKRLHSL